MIQGIQSITYSTDGSTENWTQAQKFYTDWGLTQMPSSENELLFKTLSGSQLRVLPPDHPYLMDCPAIEAGATLREVVWAVEHNTTISTTQDFTLDAAPNAAFPKLPVSILDPHGLRQRFVHSTKCAVNVQGSPTNPYGLPPLRVNTPSPVYDRAIPIDIGHVVLFSDCLNDAVAFYTKLGFVVSDSYPDRGVFLRCAANAGHHNLFLLQLPNKSKGVNHVAFTVRDIHEVFGGGLAMSRHGWKTQLGPGRHPISSAYFWYFVNPCGGLIEYNADEDHLTGDWQPREFEPSPTAFAEWAIDGGIDGHTRRQPDVAASGNFLTAKK